MKKALVSPNEVVEIANATGFRVAEVADQAFDVAPPLFWVDCPDECVSDFWFFNTETNAVAEKPAAPDDEPATPAEVSP
jgi:hypothetical protein